MHRGETVRAGTLARITAPVALTDAALVEARNVLDRHRAVGDALPDDGAVDGTFLEALKDDLNTPAAMARLHELAGAANRGDGDAAVALKSSAAVMGLLGRTADEWARGDAGAGSLGDDEIESMIAARNEARATRDLLRRTPFGDGGGQHSS